jgi:hypothetical protein
VPSIGGDASSIGTNSGRDLRFSGVVRRLGSPSGSARTARVAFAVVVAVALPLLLFWGRRWWFVVDDWDFLVKRTGGDLGDLFRAHGGHWTTLPVAVYRFLWWVVGIRDYAAYQVVAIALHLTTASLLRVVMRRAGVGPWLATVVATVFVFFGSGSANIINAFQMTFTGSLAFGLAHLLLATHEGRVDRRDLLGLLSGLAALMCSGVGISMLIAVLLAVLLLRGWRVALLHTAPLAGAYLLWFAIIGRKTAPALSRLSASDVASFVVNSTEAAFHGIGQLPGLGLVYALTLTVGLALLLARSRRAALSSSAASTLGLLAGAVVFVFTTALIRSTPLSGLAAALFGASGSIQPRAGRYVYVLAALILPAVALAAQTLIRAWRPAAAVVAAMLLVSLVGNVHALTALPSRNGPQDLRRFILTVPRLPAARQLPRSLVVAPTQSLVTVGWLVDNAHAGRVPGPGRLSEADISNEMLTLTLGRWPAAAPAQCRALRQPVVVTIRANDGLRVKTGAITVAYAPLEGARSRVVTLSRGGSVENVFKDPLRLLVAPARSTGPVAVCMSVAVAVAPGAG